MKAWRIFEKFTEESDPIYDMGIGMDHKIQNWLDTLELWRRIDIKNQINDALDQCFYKRKKDFISYIINHHSDYNVQRALQNSFSYEMHEFVDTLIQRGAKFEDLSQKAYYVLNLEGTLATLSPEEELTVACKAGNFSLFKKCIERGDKLKIGMINALFQTDYNFRLFSKVAQHDKIIQYLRDHIDELPELVHPRDQKKLDKIKLFLGVQKSQQGQSYPHGYKIYRVLKYINENTVTSDKELSKFLYELTYGKGSYHPLTNVGYWGDGIKDIVHPKIHIDKKTGAYLLNGDGQAKLAKYEEKFGKMKITPTPYI